jgi:hypothetical protein
MNSRRPLWFSLLLLLLLVGSRTAAAQSGTCSAFVDVSVVPVDREHLLPHQTVLVRNGRIARIAPAPDLKLPHDCYIVDGRHRYLIPGLVDSHVHLPLSGTADQLLVLQLLLANGITTGINMQGVPRNRRFARSHRTREDRRAEDLHDRAVHPAAGFYDCGPGQNGSGLPKESGIRFRQGPW